MPGGQQITSGQGTLSVDTGETLEALTGSASTSASGTAAPAYLLPLRSRKAGTGSAARALTGAASVLSQGTVGRGKTFGITGLAVTVLQGTLTYAGRATIQWNANVESDLAGYRVYRGTTSGVYTQMQDVGNVTSYQWNGLTPGQTHYFVVTAYDTSNNESSNSAQVSKAY